jgi:hypothetical protein
VVNRGALLLRYKEPALRWINEADPHPRGRTLALDAVNEERTVYLIDDSVGDTPASLNRWLRKNYGSLFEAELEGWYTDPDLWPQDRTFKLFREWFQPECHTVLIDLVGNEMCDDES